MARDFLDETSRTIEALRARLVRKYDLADDLPTPELQRWLAARYRVDLGGGPIEGVLDRYQQERRRVLDFIRERDLFPIPESQDMTILRTPGFMEPSIPAGAMMEIEYSTEEFRLGGYTASDLRDAGCDAGDGDGTAMARRWHGW